jgi:hypothetical protein
MAQDTPVADSGLLVEHVYGRAQLEQWLADIDLMKAHATSQGLVLSARTIDKVCEVAKQRIRLEPALTSRASPSPDFAEQIVALIRKVLELHSDLALLIAPATPRSLGATLHRPWKERFVRPSFIAGLLALALFAIVVFVLTVALAGERKSTVGGQRVLVEQLNWMAAAALGATFSALFTAYRYIVSRTFDPQYTAVYWVRIILGGVAGVVLANFGQRIGGTPTTFTPPLLALLGGYSAEAVNQLLMRFTEMLVAAVKGNNETQLREKEKEVTTVKAKAREELARQKERTAEELTAILDDAKRAAAPAALIDRLNGTLARVQSSPLA